MILIITVICVLTYFGVLIQLIKTFPMLSSTINIDLPQVNLKADLTIPPKACSIILFVHGSGSSRLSPRNQQVARHLNNRGLATLLFDLLIPQEDHGYTNRFNIPLLSRRLVAVTDWVRKHPLCKHMHIGYFGASTGSAAALAASCETHVDAIVSRGGRPDLASESLPMVEAPTLLIVGGSDTDVLKLNQQSLELMNTEKRLDIVEGATHLFEEKGAMEKVAVLAEQWFELHMEPLTLKK